MSAADFEAGVKFVQASSGIKLSNDVKLAFYSLFKQATDGPCNEKAPSRLRIIEYSKWKAWADLKQMSKDDAKVKYVEALTKAVPTWKTQAKL